MINVKLLLILLFKKSITFVRVDREKASLKKKCMFRQFIINVDDRYTVRVIIGRVENSKLSNIIWK